MLKTAERRQFVIQARRAGMTLQQVASTAESRFGKERLPKGWDDAYVAKDLSRELKKLRKGNQEDVEDLRALELDRLDALLRGLWPKASKGEERAVQKVLNVLERRAKLLGLDAPEKLDQNVKMEDTIVKILNGNLMDGL